MQFIQDKDAKKLRERLEKDLMGPVTINLFTQPESKLIIPGRECDLCKETGELLGEGVPKIVMNESVELVGAQREPQFLKAVLGAAA